MNQWQFEDSDESPLAPLALDFLALASTPLHVSHAKSAMLISPMKKLDRLHITLRDKFHIHSDVGGEDDIYSDHDGFLHTSHDADAGDNSDVGHVGDRSVHEEDNEESEDDEFAANQTLATEFSEEEYDDDGPIARDSHMSLSVPSPTFVRKRKHGDSSSMVITPQFTQRRFRLSANQSIPVSVSSCDSLLKISFSNSDSTPCPAQPRKRLKFNEAECTPHSPSESNPPRGSGKSRTSLNLSKSTKVPACSVPLITRLNDATTDDIENVENENVVENENRNLHSSTPLSQSTPANSRPPSPGTDDTSASINGFSFVNNSFKYKTPQSRPTSAYPSRPRSQLLRSAYNANTYQMVGEMPVSAAGLMDEANEDVHVGDKRINDPYLVAPVIEEESDIREMYLSSTKLPIRSYVSGDREFSKNDILTVLDDKCAVLDFYKSIYTSQDGSLLQLLKKERLRWHPDKWISKIDNSPFDMDIIRAVSQTINALIDTI